MAFVRANDPELGKFSVLTANTDGTDEKIVDQRTYCVFSEPGCMVAGGQSDRFGHSWSGSGQTLDSTT